MKVFNTGAAGFWTSFLGEQLRLLRLTSSQYHSSRASHALVEQVARQALPMCRRWSQWPLLGIRNSMVVFCWPGRGEICILLTGSQVSYVPDPARGSGTLAMVFLVGPGNDMEKFLRSAFRHLLEAKP
jgi:hypothetical protein